MEKIFFLMKVIAKNGKTKTQTAFIIEKKPIISMERVLTTARGLMFIIL
jgi:hypothetical protein